MNSSETTNYVNLFAGPPKGSPVGHEFNNRDDSDIQIQYDCTILFLHKKVLAGQSKYFANLFAEYPADTVVNLSELQLEPAVIIDVLRLFYRKFVTVWNPYSDKTFNRMIGYIEFASFLEATDILNQLIDTLVWTGPSLTGSAIRGYRLAAAMNHKLLKQIITFKIHKHINYAVKYILPKLVEFVPEILADLSNRIAVVDKFAVYYSLRDKLNFEKLAGELQLQMIAPLDIMYILGWAKMTEYPQIYGRLESLLL